MNWRKVKINWAKKTDSEIAAQFGLTRQTVQAARKRLGAPPSPAGHGGYRHGAGRAPGNEIAKASKHLTPAQIQKVLAYIQRLTKK